jgi:glucokinase
MPERPEGAILGVDVGGTKLAVGHVVGREVVASVQHPTPRTNAADVIAGLEAAINELRERCGPPIAIGIGVPSQVDFATGRVISSVNIPLSGIDLRHELSDHFGVPVVVDNDANCAALAEAQFVSDPPARHLVMLTLGTGVGGGIVIDGRIYRGATGLGAELGHVVLQADGPECPGACPNHGCMEALCSGTALGRDALELARARPDSRLGRALAEEGSVTGLHVVNFAREGDGDSLELLERLGTWLGVGISSMINAFEPEFVVVGGGLCVAADLFMGEAEREARSRALPALVERVRIEVASAGPAAGIIGAALLATHMLDQGEPSTPNRDTPDLIANRGVQ